MSRSRKKNPVSSVACCDSEKEDKRHANRRFRRKVRGILTRIVYDDIELDTIFPLIREVSNIWSFGKDGKTWWGNNGFNEYRRSPRDQEWWRAQWEKMMRK